MVTVEALVLGGHIAAGVVALLAGLGALLTTKGGLRHRQAGNIYVVAMGVVVGTVVPLFALAPTDPTRQFLLLVAVFSGYLAFSGYRVLARKRPADAAESVNWAGAVLVVAACAGLGVLGGSRLVGGDSFGLVLLVFGFIGGTFGVLDLKTFWTDAAEAWVVSHLTRMVSAFIATVTAVSAVNLTMVPAVVAWLWPTAVGVPLIIYWQRVYGRESR
jgi:hypothetical protein